MAQSRRRRTRCGRQPGPPIAGRAQRVARSSEARESICQMQTLPQRRTTTPRALLLPSYVRRPVSGHGLGHYPHTIVPAVLQVATGSQARLAGVSGKTRECQGHATPAHTIYQSAAKCLRPNRIADLPAANGRGLAGRSLAVAPHHASSTASWATKVAGGQAQQPDRDHNRKM